MIYENQTIDDLKKEYEYKIDPSNFIDTIFIIYAMRYGLFINKLKDYRFNEKIKEIQKIIHNKGDKIDKNILESFEKTLKEISDGCEIIEKQVNLERNEMGPILVNISYDYKKYADKPGAADIYQKIGKEIIDKAINKYIHYEKILISYNDYIINIKKNLTN